LLVDHHVDGAHLAPTPPHVSSIACRPIYRAAFNGAEGRTRKGTIMALSKRQKAIRVQGVGASEVAAVCGLSRWKSAIDVWRAKVAPDAADEDERSYAAELGNEIEEPIARVWAKRTGRYLARVDTLRSSEHPLALATPDRAVYLTREARGEARGLRDNVRDAERLLQVKSTTSRLAHLWGAEGSDVVPDEYLIQAHWEGAVAGVDLVEFAVDFDKRALKSYTVRVDRALFASLYDTVERFWREHVEPKIVPPPDASEAYRDGLRRVFPRETSGDVVKIDGPEFAHVREAVRRYVSARHLAKFVEGVETEARNVVEHAIGVAQGLTFDTEDGPVVLTWRANRPSVLVDWQGVAGDAMRLAALALQADVSPEVRAGATADLASLIAKHTTQRAGARVLRRKTTPEAWNLVDEVTPAARGEAMFGELSRLAPPLVIPATAPAASLPLDESAL
jgi:putative phage-type endonuclease